jgi:hypothetical protein
MTASAKALGQAPPTTADQSPDRNWSVALEVSNLFDKNGRDGATKLLTCVLESAQTLTSLT